MDLLVVRKLNRIDFLGQFGFQACLLLGIVFESNRFQELIESLFIEDDELKDDGDQEDSSFDRVINERIKVHRGDAFVDDLEG